MFFAIIFDETNGEKLYDAFPEKTYLEAWDRVEQARKMFQPYINVPLGVKILEKKDSCY